METWARVSVLKKLKQKKNHSNALKYYTYIERCSWKKKWMRRGQTQLILHEWNDIIVPNAVKWNEFTTLFSFIIAFFSSLPVSVHECWSTDLCLKTAYNEHNNNKRANKQTNEVENKNKNQIKWNMKIKVLPHECHYMQMCILKRTSTANCFVFILHIFWVRLNLNNQWERILVTWETFLAQDKKKRDFHEFENAFAINRIIWLMSFEKSFTRFRCLSLRIMLFVKSFRKRLHTSNFPLFCTILRVFIDIFVLKLWWIELIHIH